MGTYPLQEGSIKVFPGNTTTEYTLTANGQCEITKKITIRVVHEGEIAVIVANGNQDVGFEANIQPNSTSSKIIVSSIKSVQCAGNASFWPNWNCTKTDTTGVNYLSPSDKETPVKCLLFVGKWQFKPTQMAYSEKTACFQVTYGCAPCVTPTPQPTMFPVPTPAPSV
ncbi:MAG: hypothetical protein NTX88_09015 [Candidatus Atribacteria bacterium]|nr:hypothetical protein [Candidatus Atribacteria bacterium]